MNPNETTTKIITAWVASLSDLCSHSAQAKPSKNAIASYAVVLGQSLPSGAFTAESLAHVASACEWFPAVAVMQKMLADWWRDHKPASAPMLTDGRDKPGGWTVEDESWLKYWNNNIGARRAQEDALGERLSAIDPPQRPAARLASLVRRYSPRAWAFIANDPPHAQPVDDGAFARIQASLAFLDDMPSHRPPAPKPLGSVALSGEALRLAREGQTQGYRLPDGGAP